MKVIEVETVGCLPTGQRAAIAGRLMPMSLNSFFSVTDDSNKPSLIFTGTAEA